MTSPNSTRAAANRRRILDIALDELLRDPDASMDQIARAAGLVRRTLYGHFANREALFAALTDTAVEDVTRAFAVGAADPAAPADIALARSTLAVWQYADRYRLLVSLAQHSITDAGIRARLEPVRRNAATVIQQGLDDGLFHSPLPARALAHLHEHTLFGLMQAVNDGALPTEGAGAAAVTAVLASVGVPPERAAEVVRRVRTPDAPGAPDESG
ncbi:TetR/AcrR family transcriptional regulator [Streptomyces sp. H27-D2]|uniref:TetR/AcrR family transcriptional regulator n=1 Tax=Streptomyces sp. H27-D2 TaxID=3046304 RepID=UPI002DBE7EFB|nr:TetR/AcrR family transcriptional regulator [Streptomyces sp. H27-D2]MEC4019713.1 TetR/AcrR family transcriptional regulator [Streptomyces sp. H27-D2]